MAAQLASSWHLEHLLKWLHMFDLQNHLPSSESLSDGVLVSKVLNQIDSQWFHEEWLLKIKNNIGSNKILKVSNWKKVLERLVDYYEVHLDQRLSGFTMPDASKIVESDDEGELCRLLQLVLGCAVRCERQEEFIQAILQMEEDVQRGIMAAIQGLPGIELAGGSLADMAGRSPSQTAAMGYHNLISQLEAANDEKDLLVKKHQQQNRQISELQEEIQHLHNEIEALRSGTGPMESLDKSDVGQPTALMLKREIQRLTEELLRSDYARDDYRNRCDVLEQELDKMRMRQDELQGAAEQTRSLKDEVDILRERSAKLENAQSTIDSMRRKVEEGTELRRQLRKLEEKNSQYIQQNLELEEELKKLGPWKSQLEAQKKQITEVQSELEEERRRADKFELQFKNMLERNEALTQEKERLLAERGKLVERNEELQYAQLNNGAMMMDGSPTTDVDTLDMIPPEIREKMLRLQHENRLLKEKKDAEAEVLQTDNAGLSERIAQLEAENRCGFCRAAIRNKCLNNVPPPTTQQIHRESSLHSSEQPSVSLVATIKARLASKPVFAGSLMASPPRVPNRLNGSASCSQLGLSSSSSSVNNAPVLLSSLNPLISESGSNLSAVAVTTTASSSSSSDTAKTVERLKGAFFAGSNCSVTATTSQSSRVFTRSASFGYDKALGFASTSSSSSSSFSSTILDAATAGKWANSESVCNKARLRKLENASDRGSGLRFAALRRESDPAVVSKMTTVEPKTPSPSSSIVLQQQQQQPPPPVEAVVITRDSSPRGDETDSGYRIGYDESAPSPVNGGSHYFVEDESLLMEYTGRLRYNKADRTRSSLPDDAIEIDSSFHHGGSIDSESVSVSSFSIISETVASSDRSFEQSESLLLTPRSTTRSSMQQDDTLSKKSFGKSLKKRKMFKAAANAMFSLCGP